MSDKEISTNHEKFEQWCHVQVERMTNCEFTNMTSAVVTCYNGSAMEVLDQFNLDSPAVQDQRDMMKLGMSTFVKRATHFADDASVKFTAYQRVGEPFMFGDPTAFYSEAAMIMKEELDRLAHLGGYGGEDGNSQGNTMAMEAIKRAFKAAERSAYQEPGHNIAVFRVACPGGVHYNLYIC